MAIEHLVYADESETQQSSYCIVSGYIGRPRQWKRFENAWRETLKGFSVPEFHAIDFFGGRKLFRHWSGKQRQRFLDSLVAILVSRRLFPIGAAVNVATFTSYSYGERRYLTNGVIKEGKFISSGAPARPYQLAFSSLLYAAADKTEEGDRVNYILDRNTVEEGLARQVFNDTKINRRFDSAERMNCLAFSDRISDVGLQAADLYAYLSHAILTKRHDMSPQQQGVLKRLIRRNKYHMDLWEEGQMDDALSTLSSSQRKALAAEES